MSGEKMIENSKLFSYNFENLKKTNKRRINRKHKTGGGKRKTPNGRRENRSRGGTPTDRVQNARVSRQENLSSAYF
jgi:hypothetical protein